MNLYFSFIVPVYNRPEEIKELLESFLQLDTKDSYEVVIVEDGSTLNCKSVVDLYIDKMDISYYLKENTGPGDSRNYGMSHAKGNYFIILDSDCLLPPHYLSTVTHFLSTNYVDCYGGADAAHCSFTNLQKAINYVMTSFLTTGGIRGNARRVQQFEPRSFNMGISKAAFEKTNGFSKIHPGEDPDLSRRILKSNYKIAFIPKAFVYHKRRISWQKFYKQVQKFGLVRPILNRWHPESAKLTFWLPSLFVLFVLSSLLLSLLAGVWYILPLLTYLLVLFVDSSLKNQSVIIGGLSILAVFVQFFGYGLAFIRSSFYIGFLRREPEKQYPNLFFK